MPDINTVINDHPSCFYIKNKDGHYDEFRHVMLELTPTGGLLITYSPSGRHDYLHSSQFVSFTESEEDE